MESISSQRLGVAPVCRFCGAGSLLSFNWEYAKKNKGSEHARDVSVFVKPAALRCGALYECLACKHPWYLYGEPPFMNFVQRDRLELIKRWNAAELTVPAAQAARLKDIGPTPPDIYGNGRQYAEFPCAVTTVDGRTVERAVVSLQRHAPFEEWRDYQLATEILEVRPSPYALPLQVRVATAKAEEIRMGFAPTLVELPDGETVALNWSEHFFVREGIDAGKVRLSKRELDMRNPPPIYNGPRDAVYFVADRWPP